MGNRYLITGVQLGMLKAFISLNESKEADDLIETILENQYLGKKRGELSE